MLFYWTEREMAKLEAQMGRKSLTCIKLIMISYIEPWWQFWVLYQIAFSKSDSACCLDQNRLILVILNLLNTPMPSIKFQLNPTYGGHLGYRNGTILAFLHLHLYVAPVPSANIQLNTLTILEEMSKI